MRGILTLFFLGSFIYSNAQNFTKERDKFIKECQRAFVQIDQQTFTKEKLPKLVESTQFTESQFSKMVDMSNSIYSSSSNYSLVYLFVKAALYQSHNKFSGNFNSEWAKYLTEYQQKEEDKFEEFLNFSANLFEFHSIKSSDGFRWVFLKGDLSWKKEKSLSLVCDDGNLFCYMVSESGKYYDSIQVSSTSGVLDVDAGKFTGNDGILTWEKVGFDKKETFAELRRYKVDLSRAFLKVDTVALTTPYFPIPILGKLIDKTYSELMDGEEAPQFNSFEKRLKIKSLRENMDYDGGFSLEGKKFIGRGDDLRPAKVIFKVKEKPIFEVTSLNFSMDPAQIISREARLKLYYDNGDSLIHSNCLFYFDEAKQLVTLTAKKSGTSVFPFEDFYFKVYVYAPVFCWRINSFQPITPMKWELPKNKNAS
jgi:hypothetical protein